jgi:serine protease Do
MSIVFCRREPAVPIKLGRDNRRRLRQRARAVSVTAGLLLAASLWSPLGRADDKPAVVQGSDRSQQSSSKAVTLPAPKPLPGKRGTVPTSFRKDTPISLDDLKSIEGHVKGLLSRVSPAVVAVEVGGGSGSGVVISEDGLVLCAAHVCVTTNRNVLFTFADGKTARGKTLGTNHEVDAGLMKITDKGPWPHVEVGELDRARLGDWVLAMGHPGGFDPERSMVVRLGRIIRLTSEMLQTDCTLMGGDSGGPLFDMHGRVVAIHSRISTSTTANFHVSIEAFQDSWERLARSEDWGGRRPPPPDPWLGIFGLDYPKDRPNGFRVELVNSDGPARKAGLTEGDIVMKFDGKRIRDFAAFKKYESQTSPGEDVVLEIRRGEMEMSVTVTVVSRRDASR